MRGRNTLMDWELNKWMQEITKAIASFESGNLDEIGVDFTHSDVCPINLCMALEALDWYEYDSHLDWDYGYYAFKHSDYSYKIFVEFNPYTFALTLTIQKGVK